MRAQDDAVTIAAQAVEIKQLKDALLCAADSLDDYSPLTGRAVETSASRAAREACVAAHRKK